VGSRFLSGFAHLASGVSGPEGPRLGFVGTCPGTNAFLAQHDLAEARGLLCSFLVIGRRCHRSSPHAASILIFAVCLIAARH